MLFHLDYFDFMTFLLVLCVVFFLTILLLMCVPPPENSTMSRSCYPGS